MLKQIYMTTDIQIKTLELLKQLKIYFLNSGEIVEHNGIKKPDINLGFYMDIRDLINEIDVKLPKEVKQK